MMDVTARWALPMLAAGQSQKELVHNEALLRLDSCVAPCVETIGMSAPPSDPTPGSCYLVGNGAAGVWAGRQDSIAVYSEGGWRFIEPREGFRVWIAGQQMEAIYKQGAWQVGTVYAARLKIAGAQVVGQQEPATPDPIGGSSIDTEARAAVVAILGALRNHGLIAC